MTIIENVMLNSTNTEKRKVFIILKLLSKREEKDRLGTKVLLLREKFQLTYTKGAEKEKRSTEGKNPVKVDYFRFATRCKMSMIQSASAKGKLL